MRQSLTRVATRAVLILSGVAVGVAVPFAYAQERAAQAKTLEERVTALEKRLTQLERTEFSQTAQPTSPSLSRRDYEAAVRAYNDFLRPSAASADTPFEFNGRTIYRVPLSVE